MSDEALLPFLSEFDPPVRAEGSIDPLGSIRLAGFIPCRGVLDFIERPTRKLDAARQRGNGLDRSPRLRRI